MIDQTTKNETNHPAVVLSSNCNVVISKSAQLLNKMNTKLYNMEKVRIMTCHGSGQINDDAKRLS